MRKKNVALLVAAASLAGPVAANAALVSTDGGLGVYDTINDVTWTSNANLLQTQELSYSGGAAALVSQIIAASGGVIHDTPNTSDTVPNSGTYTLSASDFNDGQGGAMNWWAAQAWVHYLNVIHYGGSNQWALPTTANSPSSSGTPDGLSGNPSPTSGQLAELFYGSLGQVASTGIDGTHNESYALFSNVQPAVYWSGTESSATPYSAWAFSTRYGIQSEDGKYQNLSATPFFALAVAPGNVNPVPLPAAAWLLLSGLGGLGAFARKKRAA